MRNSSAEDQSGGGSHGVAVMVDYCQPPAVAHDHHHLSDHQAATISTSSSSSPRSSGGNQHPRAGPIYNATPAPWETPVCVCGLAVLFYLTTRCVLLYTYPPMAPTVEMETLKVSQYRVSKTRYEAQWEAEVVIHNPNMFYQLFLRSRSELGFYLQHFRMEAGIVADRVVGSYGSVPPNSLTRFDVHFSVDLKLENESLHCEKCEIPPLANATAIDDYRRNLNVFVKQTSPPHVRIITAPIWSSFRMGWFCVFYTDADQYLCPPSKILFSNVESPDGYSGSLPHSVFCNSTRRFDLY